MPFEIQLTMNVNYIGRKVIRTSKFKLNHEFSRI